MVNMGKGKRPERLCLGPNTFPNVENSPFPYPFNQETDYRRVGMHHNTFIDSAEG